MSIVGIILPTYIGGYWDKERAYIDLNLQQYSIPFLMKLTSGEFLILKPKWDN